MAPMYQSGVPERVPTGASRPWCDACTTDTYLVIESMDPSRTAPRQALKVSYTCMKCGGYYAHDVSRDGLSLTILRRFPAQAQDAVDGPYLHCGEPMTMGTVEERPVVTTLSYEAGAETDLEVYLRTKVLHCRCGFQMEIPRPEVS